MNKCQIENCENTSDTSTIHSISICGQCYAFLTKGIDTKSIIYKNLLGRVIRLLYDFLIKINQEPTKEIIKPDKKESKPVKKEKELEYIKINIKK